MAAADETAQRIFLAGPIMKRGEADRIHIRAGAAQDLAEAWRVHVQDHQFFSSGRTHRRQYIKPIIRNRIDEIVCRNERELRQGAAVSLEEIAEHGDLTA